MKNVRMLKIDDPKVEATPYPEILPQYADMLRKMKDRLYRVNLRKTPEPVAKSAH